MSDALYFYSTAKGYVQSAFLIMNNPDRSQLPDDTSLFLSCHMLFGFAVELYLKAYLRYTGHNKGELKKGCIGHNLKKLLTKSQDNGFCLSAAKNLTEYLGQKHASFEYRYMKSDSKYHYCPLAVIFSDLSELDAYVDRKIGASASTGKEISTRGWNISSDSEWRL